jgi:large subunit ribosomal protein L15
MTLKVHHLRPAPGAHTARTRVGRGDASKGKSAGRGTKGSKARNQIRPSFEGGQMPIHMRLPKVKVLGSGDLGGVRVNVTAHAFSASAREKITAAGGSVTEL